MTEQQLRYSRVAVTFHWLIAAIIIFELVVGLVMEGLQNRELRVFFVRTHSSLGLIVLVLSVARIAWRLTHKPPPLDARLAPWEHRIAHVAHVLLYVMMIAMPMLGWSILSASERSLKLGLTIIGTPIRWPHLPIIKDIQQPQLDIIHDQFVQAHTIGGYIMIALLLGHIAGVIKHQWYDRHTSLQRMWFGKRS